MPRHDDHFHPEPTRRSGPAPESAAGGAHPDSTPALPGEYRAAGPEDVPGDAAIERRRGADPTYQGPERRLAKR